MEIWPTRETSLCSWQTMRGNTVPGWSSTVLTVMTMGCLQLLAFGVLANYFRRLVFARDLPPWVVRTSRLASLPQPDAGPGPREDGLK